MAHHRSKTEQLRPAPARRTSPAEEHCVRFDTQQSAGLCAEQGSFGEEQRMALSLLRQHPRRWFRPATDARLLACLVLALEGFADAVEDNDGMRFRYAHPVQLLA